MTLSERVKCFNTLFCDLQETNSLNMKRAIVEQLPEELKEDFEFILECLAGKHVFGYKFETSCPTYIVDDGDIRNENNTVKDVLQFLLEPNQMKDLSMYNIQKHICQVRKWIDFFAIIVDKKLKLGIGKSLLPKEGLSVMLAKKFEGKIKTDINGYFITEKLDGNRCVAHFDGIKWVFTSRNGKPMHVNFDMSGLPKEYVYDGEILSPEQVKLSNAICEYVYTGKSIELATVSFNKTSGLINRHDTNKQLVYNIFDIMVDGVEYFDRRIELTKLEPLSKNVRILPVLAHVPQSKLNEQANELLDIVVKAGGEGVMINLASEKYQHKRTDGLIKFKPVYSMDMVVEDIEYGSGKYECMVGALICKVVQNGKTIRCRVGTGLTDEQREIWSIHPDAILDKIVEVGYFAISQNSNDFGTNNYSLRFPRFIKVRKDKIDTNME